MKALIPLLGLLVLACQPSAEGPTIETETSGGYTFTTLSSDSLSMTHVEVNDSTAAVFLRKPQAGGGFPGINTGCLTCRISNISECGEEECADGQCTSDEIQACARRKCEDSGQCPTREAVGVFGGLIYQ